MSIIISILFCIAPFLVIPLIFIGIFLDRKHSLVYGFLLALIFAIISYNFKPSYVHDLYRYFVEMEVYFSKMNFLEYLTTSFYNTKILFKLFQYIIAQFSNYNLLQFIITLIGYYISFYIILDFSKIKNYKPFVTIFTLLIFILTFYHINFISGLSQYLAICIGFLAFYLEFIKEKKKPIYKLLYILPLFIHASMIIIPMIRFILKFDFNKTKVFYIICLLIYSLFPNVIYFFIKFIPGLGIIANKINLYMVGSSMNSYSTYYIFTTVFSIFYILLFYFYKKRIKDLLPIKFLNFMELILILNVFSIFYSAIFTRILNLTILCMNVFIQVYISEEKKINKYIVMIILVVFGILMGNVTLNNILANNFNDIFSNLNKNIFYYLK